MPTLEDTVDFKVVTLNDLLDADVRTGVPVPADDKYKRWAYLSTGAAGMLLIALIVALVTGGAGSGSSSQAKSSAEFPAPPNTRPLSVNAGTADLEGILPGTKVTLYDADTAQMIANGATVLKITEKKIPFPKGATSKSVRVAVKDQEVQAVTQAKTVKIVEGATATTTTAPAATAPVPIQPAPATTAPAPTQPAPATTPHS